MDTVSRTIDCEVAGLAAMKNQLDYQFPTFERVVVTLLGSSRVIFSGMGKSGHVAQKVASTFTSLGTPASFLHPADAAHGDLGIIRKDDAIVVMSWSGESAELEPVVNYAKRFSIPLIAVTSNSQSTLGKAADLTLKLPQVDEACPLGLAPTTSTTMQMVLGDCLAIALLEKRGFTREDFSALHPGGNLGAKLKRVYDIMHRNPPCVMPDTLMNEAIIIMTAKAFGCVGVVQNDMLIGIVTDGDLRRHIYDEKLMKLQVRQVMTPRPKTIKPEALAVVALEVMNASEITALFVVDEVQQPVGIIHIHDLLSHGVA